MKPGAQWPIAIGSILALTVAVNIGVFIVAGDDPSFAIEPDYYRKAVHWDDQMAQRRASDALGWRIEPTFARLPQGGARLAVRLVDASGAPIRGASVQVTALRVARASRVLHATLAPSADDAYAAPLDADRDGQWELRFTATRGTARFTSVERVELSAGGP